MIDTADSARAAQLRDGLINQLRDLGAVRTETVATAVRTVPRHLFVPEATLEQAYQAERAEVTKRDGYGVALSAISAARIQAFMLEQADIRPGMRVLEIGSGGYNAAPSWSARMAKSRPLTSTRMWSIGPATFCGRPGTGR